MSVNRAIIKEGLGQNGSGGVRRVIAYFGFNSNRNKNRIITK